MLAGDASVGAVVVVAGVMGTVHVVVVPGYCDHAPGPTVRVHDTTGTTVRVHDTAVTTVHGQ